MVEIKHKFVSPAPATPSNTLVQGPTWNEEHNFEQGAKSLLGRMQDTEGPTEEVPLDDETLTFIDGKLSAIGLAFQPQQLTSAYLAITEINVPQPSLNRDAEFVVDGVIVGDIEFDEDLDIEFDPSTVMLTAQVHVPRENGLYNFSMQRATITGISKGDPATISATAHGHKTGDKVRIAHVLGMIEINGRSGDVTVLGPDLFQVDIDTTTFTTYASGGVANCGHLVRDADMAAGSTVKKPYYVVCVFGATQAGVNYELVEQSAVVNIDDVHWVQSLTGGSLTSPNTFLGGSPYQQSRPVVSAYRTFAGSDMPLMYPSYGQTNVQRVTIARSLDMGRLSQVTTWADPYDDRAAMMYLLKTYKEVVVDKTMNLHLPLPLVSGRRIIFEGTGWNGPRVMMWPSKSTALINEPFDLGGLDDVTFEGLCVIEAAFSGPANTPAIQTSAAFGRFRCDQLWTKGFSHAFRQTNVGTFYFNDIRTYTYPAELPVVSTVPATAASRIRFMPQVQGVDLIDEILVTGAYMGRPGASRYDVFCWGGGGGGGSGRRGAAGSARSGGLGGGAGVPTVQSFQAAQLVFPLTVTIGAAGTAGTLINANDTNGNNGGNGGDTTLGNSPAYLRALGGFGGLGGTNAAINAFLTAGAVAQIQGRTFAPSSSVTQSLLTSGVGAGAAAGSQNGGGPGGTGGSLSTGNAELLGSMADFAGFADPAMVTPPGPALAGVAGAPGQTSTLKRFAGYGGGGGGPSATAAAGAGGAGGRAAGGGGGGASTNGFASGAGGPGGAGKVAVVAVYE